MPIDHFDLIAGLYHRAAAFSLTEPLAGFLTLEKTNLLLDAGGGTGRVAQALEPYIRMSFVADLSMGMLHYAIERNLPAVCAPAEHLPFPEGQFDRIIMLDAWHHVIDQPRTADELWRVLAPDGILTIVEPDIQRAGVKVLAILEKLLLMRSHFQSGETIAGFFEHPSAAIRVYHMEATAYVAVRKVRQM
jgi:ubiquinone/menaquinone biosynthesis C-methylase UbiE